MTRYFYLIVVLAATISGCEKPSNRPASSEALASSSVSRTEADLSPSMSDEQILRAIGLDPVALKSHREQGKDGYTMVYENGASEVMITRSRVSGVTVIRLRPAEQMREWKLGKP